MTRLSHLAALAVLVLALGQTGGHAQAATAGSSFAVTVRVASACEANGICGAALVRSLGAERTAVSTVGATVTPLAPAGEGVAGQRIETRQGAGAVEIDF